VVDALRVDASGTTNSAITAKFLQRWGRLRKKFGAVRFQVGAQKRESESLAENKADFMP
jgi:phage regulator Rha-like protein